MDPLLLDWLSLLLRWAHVITAIAWIGASFYFIWLDLSLETPPADKAAKGLGGELWAIHGGGIYEVGKYRLAPPQMPATLHWFKWEAYSTWLTGSALLVAVYYLRAQSYLVGPGTWLATPAAAVAGSVAYLLVGLAVYEALVRSPLRDRPWPFAAVIVVVVTAASWLAWELFAPRAAMVHVGALLASWMAGNVFLGIIPSQKSLVAAIDAGAEPEGELARSAKARSTHNNYFTLPVLFCMLANHYPFVFAHPQAWLLTPAIALTAAVARHYFNARHRGRQEPGWLVGAALGFAALAWVASPASLSPPQDSSVTVADVDGIVHRHCAGCHAEAPSFAGYRAAPGGLVFGTAEALLSHGAQVRSAVASGYMPLANLTAMDDGERAALLAWLDRRLGGD